MARNEGYLEFEFHYSDVFKFINGDENPIIQDIRDSEEIHGIEDFIRVVKSYLDTTQKTWVVMSWMKENYPEYFDYFKTNNDSEFKDSNEWLDTGRHLVVDMVSTWFQKFLNANYADYQQMADEELKELDNYMKGFENVKEMQNNVIQPVDMMNGYNAGWLSPEGVYYGINGEISNMLHNSLANSMYEAGIIPQGDKNERNPYQWLEEHGWVKQHNNWILFGGYEKANYYRKMGNNMLEAMNIKREEIEEYPITDIQQKMVSEFGNKCCDGHLKVGFLQHPMSAAMFGMIDKQMLKQKWFTF